MKFGRALEEAIVEFITNNQDKPGHGVERFEIVGFFANSPGEHRIVEQALARLVKKGELVEDRGREPNGIPTYLLPSEVIEIDSLYVQPNDGFHEMYQRALNKNFDPSVLDKITVRQISGTFHVIDGNHRVAAAKAYGFKTIPYKEEE